MSGYGGYSSWEGSIKDFPGALKPEEKDYFNKQDKFDSGDDRPSGGDFLKEFARQLGGGEQDKYRSQAEKEQRPTFGDSNKGNAGQVLENLGAIFPQQHAPVYMPGVQGSSPFGTIGRIAGMIGGGLLGGPLGIGAAAGMSAGGAIGGGIGSFF
jgi:hypothetical protein